MFSGRASAHAYTICSIHWVRRREQSKQTNEQAEEEEAEATPLVY